jgi:NADH-quinone oxidoreductase subunit H
MDESSSFFTSASFLIPSLGFLKAFAICMFALNVGVVLTWAERRIRCMIQDCIGPNRAAIPIPGKVAAVGLAMGPGATAALAVLGLAYLVDDLGGDLASWGMAFLQGAILLAWITAAGISRAVHRTGRGNALEQEIASLGAPRTIALFGVALHFAGLLFGFYFDNSTSPEGDSASSLFWGSAGALAFMLLSTAGHIAAQMWKEETVRLRLLGLLHPAADGLKTAFKADFIPPKGDRLLYNLAPWITLLPALVLLAVVPFGPSLCFGTNGGEIDFLDFQGIESVGQRCLESSFSMQVADLNVGILYFFAMGGTGIVGAALAGWASDNKFSLLGGMRAASQMVSYEVTLGLTVIGALMVYGSVRIDEMVLWQAENAWGIFVQPLAFFLFLAAAIAETKRVPFDIPEGESEIVAGYFTEYAGMKFAMFFFSEFIAVVSSSTWAVALFLGGWHLPFVTAFGIEIALGDVTYYTTSLPGEALAVIGVLGFIGKILAVCLLQVFIRWTLPRFRYDQLMRLSWRMLLPVSLFNVMATATVILAIDSFGPQAQEAVAWLGQASMLLIAATGLLGGIAFIVFLFTPTEKQHRVVNSAARYAEMMGGTREAEMEA